jgi:hypothetical protein
MTVTAPDLKPEPQCSVDPSMSPDVAAWPLHGNGWLRDAELVFGVENMAHHPEGIGSDQESGMARAPGNDNGYGRQFSIAAEPIIHPCEILQAEIEHCSRQRCCCPTKSTANQLHSPVQVSDSLPREHLLDSIFSSPGQVAMSARSSCRRCIDR